MPSGLGLICSVWCDAPPTWALAAPLPSPPCISLLLPSTPRILLLTHSDVPSLSPALLSELRSYSCLFAFQPPAFLSATFMLLEKTLTVAGGKLRESWQRRGLGWEGRTEKIRSSSSKCWRQFIYCFSGAVKMCRPGRETVNTRTTEAAQNNGVCRAIGSFEDFIVS